MRFEEDGVQFMEDHGRDNGFGGFDPAVFCEHANEDPRGGICVCPKTCSCRQRMCMYPKVPTEIRITDEKTGAQKGMKDCQIGAVDPQALMEVGNVAGFGNKKYERYNFAKGYKWSLSYDAMQRHLMAFWNGEDRDLESGLPHLAHAAWHCLALLTFTLRNRGTDDRFPVQDMQGPAKRT